MELTNLSEQSILPVNFDKNRIEAIFPIATNVNSKIILYVRQSRVILGYEYQSISNNWKVKFNQTIFNEGTDYSVRKYPWFVSDKLLSNRNVVLINHPDGIRFYQPNFHHSNLELLAEDGNFHEVYGWSNSNQIMLFGNFYPKPNELGLLTRNSNREIKFYAATEESFLDENISDPLFHLDKQLVLSTAWNDENTEFFITDILHSKPSTIVLRTTSGLEFYKFDNNYMLKLIFKSSQMVKSIQNDSKLDRLFFGDLTHQLYQDILYFNNEGLHIFQYNNVRNDYILLHQDKQFSKSKGWSPKYYDSIKLADINGDTRDDLIFTGSQGLTVLTYDLDKKNWKMLLNPLHLKGKQRFSTIVGSLPSIPPFITKPSIFIQDTDGNLVWAKVTSQLITTTSSPVTTSTTTKTSIVKTSTVKTYSVPKISPENTHLIPKQVPRQLLSKKPFLRWSEQYDNSFFKDMVDTSSGQVRFKVPLVDITSYWNIHLDLFYHSEMTSSELLGEGWYLSLTQDYIMVDHQDSIFPEDAVYYFVLQGQQNRLKCLSKGFEKMSFQLVDITEESSIKKIEYYPAKQYWIIEIIGEQIVYGKSNQRESKDAIQWSLGWPYWNGPGQDTNKLQPMITAWYVNSRVSKNSKKVLYFDYEQNLSNIGGKFYTSSLRLKNIRDHQQIQLVLEYEQKGSNEFITPNPINNEGKVVFPIALADSHYLKGLTFTTHEYQQTLEFIYQISNGLRLLSAIRQPLSSYHEIVLKFNYERILEKTILKSCTTANGLTVNFNFEVVSPPSAQRIMIKYPIEERPQIAYGLDYAVIAFNNLDSRGGKITFQILKRDMTKVITDCSNNSKLICPAASSEILNYSLYGFDDYFVVILETKDKKFLNFVNQHQGNWISEETVYTVSASAWILCNKDIIVISEANYDKIMIFEHNSNQSKWTKTQVFTRSKPLTRLVVHNTLIVGYDDSKLFIIYQDSSSVWRTYSLASNLEGFQKVLNGFDLSNELRKQLLEALNKNGLQILNNFIAFNSMQEENGQLFSHVHLFLLDHQYQVVQKQTFVIRQENINQLKHNQEYQNSNFEMMYEKENNKFKLKIKNISGKITEDLLKTEDSSTRQYLEEHIINQLNESDSWKYYFQNQMLIDVERYIIQINQKGVYCGNNILLEITGAGWQWQELSIIKPIYLGKHFILKPSKDHKSFELYNQNNNNGNQGQMIQKFLLYSPGLLVNRYPFYIAYQNSLDSVNVLTFKDAKTIGKLHNFINEQLLLESDWENLLTMANISTHRMVHSESQELRVRPLINFLKTDLPKIFVSKMELTDGEVHRFTGYQHTFNLNTNTMVYTENAVIIPTANKNTSGWFKIIKSYYTAGNNVEKSEQYFDSHGNAVLAPLEDQLITEKVSTKKDSTSHLYDRDEKWLICDFTPFSINDEMVAYYGFESYEKNLISMSNNIENIWQLDQTKLIEKEFSFTGQNYVQLQKSSIIQGVFKPKYQTINYIASSWIRSNTPLKIESSTSIFQAILKTSDGQRIIGLHATVKNKSENWYYLEVLINFSVIKDIYQDFYNVSKTITTSLGILPSPEVVKFSISLQISVEEDQQIIDVDHIRFSPTSYDFEVMIYHPVTGNNVGILHANGLVSKTIYDRFQHEIGSLHTDGELKRFISSSQTGTIIPSPTTNINKYPNSLVFEPAFTTCQVIQPLPLASELIVMIENNYIWLWLDSVLIVDQEISLTSVNRTLNPWSSFYIEFHGQVLIEDCLIMNLPNVRVEYYNVFTEKTQVIQLVDSETIHVDETLYDELGRDAITIKTTRIHSSGRKSILAYRSNFISNKNPAHTMSVWNTGKLQGEANILNSKDQGFAYARIEYAKNPLNEKSATGLPGSEFSISGEYGTKFSKNSRIPLLSNLFPTHKGYRQTVEYNPNGSQIVKVFDKQSNQVAHYVKVPGYNHLLTTFYYDEKNNLIKILPPLYHEKVNTESQVNLWNKDEQALKPYEEKWQKALGSYFFYDDYGNLIRRITPDTGSEEYVYNNAGQKRFIKMNGSNSNESLIIYFNYDINDQLIQTGYTLLKDDVHEYVENSDLPNSFVYQEIDYSDDNTDPLIRGHIKNFITHNNEIPVIEKVSYDSHYNIVSKSTLMLMESDKTDDFFTYTKNYISNKLHELTYPILYKGEPLILVHQVNRIGQVVELGVKNQQKLIARFSYDVNGLLSQEHYQPDTSYAYKRMYHYNSPGFLEKISDPFLSEDIAYTKKGYGQVGFGDGMVMQSSFNASWPNNADGRWFQIDNLENNYSDHCIYALKRTGYLTQNNQPIRLFLQDAETSLPLVCNEINVAQKIAQKQIPRYYGHQYAYGSHQELVKAKYFTDETYFYIDPLQPQSFFAKIPEITPDQSNDIWKILTNSGYIIADQERFDSRNAIGNPGKSFFRDVDLLEDLKILQSDYTIYFSAIKRLIIFSIIQQKVITLNEFVDKFVLWTSTPTSLKIVQQQTAQKIGRMLIAKKYLHTNTSDALQFLDRKLVSILSNYSNFLLEILRVILHKFSHSLGTNPFDVKSYKIDANGNHHMFYIGSNRYEFFYSEVGNQIQKIEFKSSYLPQNSKIFSMKHDARGNVIQALHKNIQTIEYHPVSQRTTRIQLSDGRSLRFYYDAQGERVMKQVFASSGEISHETYYLRDEKGRVLVDQHIIYSSSQSSQKVLTAYIYGPRGLLGFIRNDVFYSVMTDHSGSIRLVIRDNEVVAAYDYLPYGDLMRSYGNDPQSQIMYRYTGQEWDIETGLYNYHARLYDPTIGRFYQIDPQSQYHSPYKYAGNSPISLIDPDGEIAFLPILIGALVGAYIGGAATNKKWNPTKWNYKDSKTYTGMIGGAIAGGFLPVSAAASVAIVGVGGTVAAGAVGGYVATAAANKKWEPWKWKWDEPETYNSLLQGVSAGVGVIAGVGTVHNLANKLPQLGSQILLTTSYSAAGAAAYGYGVLANDKKAAFWEWDYSKPDTWSALIDGFDIGMGLPQNVFEISRGIGKIAKNPQKIIGFVGKKTSKSPKIKDVLKIFDNPIYKTTSSLALAYYMGSSANDNFDITKWDFKSLNTYEGILNGVFFGKDTVNMMKLARKSKAKPLKSNSMSKKIIKGKNNKFHLDFLQSLDKFQQSHNKKVYKKLIDNYVANDNWRLKLRDKPNDLKVKVNDFIKMNLDQWKQGKVKPPEEFNKILLRDFEDIVQKSSKKAIKWDREIKLQLEKQKNIEFNVDVEYRNLCGGGRKKRSALNKCVQMFANNEHFAKIRNTKFKNDVNEFLKKNAISTRSLDNYIKERKAPLKNGKQYKFSIDYSHGESYDLKDSSSSSNPGRKIIDGYWLETGKEISIDPNGPVGFVFTPELQGCTIYMKHNPETNMLDIFHHRRSDRASKVHVIENHDQKYKDGIIMKYEEYLNNNNNKENTFGTPIIYRDADRVWHLAVQKITYEDLKKSNSFKLYDEIDIVLKDKVLPNPFHNSNRKKRDSNGKKLQHYYFNSSIGLNRKESFKKNENNFNKFELEICNTYASSGSSQIQFWPQKLLMKIEKLAFVATTELVIYLNQINLLSLSANLIKYNEFDANKNRYGTSIQFLMNEEPRMKKLSQLNSTFSIHLQKQLLQKPDQKIYNFTVKSSLFDVNEYSSSLIRTYNEINQSLFDQNISIPKRYLSHTTEASQNNSKVNKEYKFEYEQAVSSGSTKNKPFISKLVNKASKFLSVFNWEFPAICNFYQNNNCQSSTLLDSDSGKSFQSSEIIGDYTSYHLQGGLQLADLFIRKMTGEHYQQSLGTVDPLDEIEFRLQTSLQQWGGSDENELM